MCALFNNDTWDLSLAFETEKKPIDCYWVFTIKHNAYGTINRFKAQLVTKGDMLKPMALAMRKYLP